MVHLIPCNKTINAPLFTCMFLDHIIHLHDIPDSFISDQDSIFTSHFWKCLIKLIGINGRLSTSYHPQTDDQTEHMNQTIEQYLHIYYNYQQDNWYDYLSLTEFAYNNAYQSSIKCSPFYANYSFNLQFHINLQQTHVSDIPAAKEYAE